MTLAALFAEPAFMRIVFFMTSRALHGDPFIVGAVVTLLA